MEHSGESVSRPPSSKLSLLPPDSCFSSSPRLPPAKEVALPVSAGSSALWKYMTLVVILLITQQDSQGPCEFSSKISNPIDLFSWHLVG